MTPITLQEVERVAFTLAQQRLTFQEPIPDFGTRFRHKLESCLAVPFQRFSRRDLYPGLVKKAAILFYLLIKDHPFQNGNKRIALTTLLVFLYKNEKWLDVDNQEIYNFAVWVASSPANLKSSVVLAIEEFVKKNLTTMKRGR